MSNLTPRINRLDLPEITAPTGSVVLTADSSTMQVLNPSININVTLPIANSSFDITNSSSSNTISLRASDGSTIISIPANSRAKVYPKTETPTNSSDWQPVTIDRYFTQSGVINFTTGTTNSGGSFFTREVITFAVPFAGGTIPSITFALGHPNYSPSAVNRKSWFIEENQLSPQNPNNSQFTVTILSSSASDSGTLYWTASGLIN